MCEIRILVVDDYAPLQRFIAGMFEREKDLKIVATASGGREAVQIAKVLQPDVILMDVSLPEMSGIEATRRIREVLPGSRILFLSEHMGRDIVEEAFAAGGMGYVLKSELLNDLFSGLRAILRGERYLSRSLRESRGTRKSLD
ncbi:MAG TPA: response regulator transcription factor [Verrucomicrobiae bacterium]|nr:response regulator transcription factor [Verrucomicrobiae bacterium]